MVCLLFVCFYPMKGFVYGGAILREGNTALHSHLFGLKPAVPSIDWAAAAAATTHPQKTNTRNELMHMWNPADWNSVTQSGCKCVQTDLLC